MNSKSHWSVRLGRTDWARHTYERAPGDPLQLLGSARHGQQSGALARIDGAFVLVVGDHITELGESAQRELTSLMAQIQPVVVVPTYQIPPERVGPAPVVIVKKRRVPVMSS